MNKTVKKIATGAMIAALYAVLTFVFQFISFGPIQFRISEALTILPFFSPIATAGLTVGCLISNMLSPYMWLDVVFGTLATFLGAFGTQLLSKKQKLWFLAPLPTVISNTVIIGLLLSFYESGSLLNTTTIFLLNAGMVFLGEVACCFGLGLPLLILLRKYKKNLFII